MTRLLLTLATATLLAACSREPATSASGGDTAAAATTDTIAGPFPKTVKGTIGSSFPLAEEGGPIKLFLLEYDKAPIVVSAATYDAKGMAEDDAEVTLTVEPLAADQCGGDSPCFRGY